MHWSHNSQSSFHETSDKLEILESSAETDSYPHMANNTKTRNPTAALKWKQLALKVKNAPQLITITSSKIRMALARMDTLAKEAKLTNGRQL